MAEKDEKQPRTSVGIGNTESSRERYGEGPYDDGDDYADRARRGARDLGESVRETSRTVRREGSNLLTAGCDLIGGIFIGIGEAISPRGRSGASRVNCAPITSACGGAQDEDDTAPPRRSRSSEGGSRVSTSRTEVRRPTSR